MKRILTCLGLSAILVPVGFSISMAERGGAQPPESSFAVTIRNFSGNESTPEIEHEVVFIEGLIYTFPSRVDVPFAIIDVPADRITLIHQEGSAHTTISMADLLSMTARLRASATDPEVKEWMGIDAAVDSSTNGDYTLTFGDLDYHTTSQVPEEPSWARRFGEFVDWALRINLARKQGVPPFGRMRLSAKMASDGRIPDVLRLQIHDSSGGTYHHRSMHTFTDEIDDHVREKIARVNQLVTLSKHVPLSEF